MSEQYQQVDVIPPACLKCGSTEREKYHNVRCIKSQGDRNGVQYTRITLKRTKCASCGQHRIDRIFENVPEPKPKAKKKSPHGGQRTSRKRTAKA